MPIQRTTDDLKADRERPLKYTVEGFHMGHDVDLLTFCPVGHLAWVVVLWMASASCTSD